MRIDPNKNNGKIKVPLEGAALLSVSTISDISEKKSEMKDVSRQEKKSSAISSDKKKINDSGTEAATNKAVKTDSSSKASSGRKLKTSSTESESSQGGVPRNKNMMRKGATLKVYIWSYICFNMCKYMSVCI
jgi:hypothetical protein